jgi:hypothetical protein
MPDIELNDKRTREAQMQLVLSAIQIGAKIVHDRYLPDVLTLAARGLLTATQQNQLRLRDGRKIFN